MHQNKRLRLVSNRNPKYCSEAYIDFDTGDSDIPIVDVLVFIKFVAYHLMSILGITTILIWDKIIRLYDI